MSADRVCATTPESLVEQLLEQMLYRAGLGDIEMLVGYHLPLTSQRADVVLAGSHPRTGEVSYVVVELKQWSAACAFEGDRRWSR